MSEELPPMGDDHPEWRKGPDEQQDRVLRLIFWPVLLAATGSLLAGIYFLIFGTWGSVFFCIRIFLLSVILLILVWKAEKAISRHLYPPPRP